jgi:hypothetical protein
LGKNSGLFFEEMTMAIRRVVLTNHSSKNIPFSDISDVAQALQIQVDRDFTPAWGIRATILPLNKGEAIPQHAWPMRIVNHPAGGLGIHLDKGHKPYAQIQDTDDWSVTASHELLEMLVDPYGHKFVRGPDIDPGSDGHLVSYLVEVGDPCEIYSYTINGIAVSDFVTPDYYNEASPQGTEWDFLTRLSAPYEVPQGCYISWIDLQDRRWHQKQTDGSFVTARVEVSPKDNPRNDRDAAFSDDDMRHDLPRIRNTYLAEDLKRSA